MLICFFLIENEAFAQYTKVGTDPSGAKWSVIENNHYKVIYPTEMDSMARRFLFQFESTRNLVNEGLRIDPKKIPIILHPYSLTGTSNVDYTPARLDLYTTPPAYKGYAVSWERQQALHLGRRIAHQAFFETGIYKTMSYFIGEHALFAGMKLYPSTWFMRGDAVHVETDFTDAGPGRDPTFLMYYRAAFLNDDFRNYRTWRYGSYKHYSPDRYPFGYIIESSMRNATENYYYTANTFQILVDRWWDIPVGKAAYNENTKFSRGDHFRRSVKDYSEMWRRDFESRGKYTPFSNLVAQDTAGFYKEYRSPILMDDGNIYAVLSGYQLEPQIVKITPNGQQHKVRTFSPTTGIPIRKDGHTLLWTETVPDLRWDLRDYSVLRSLDINTGRYNTITYRTRYFNPAYSPDNNIVTVAEYPVEGSSWLVFLDPEKGTVLDKAKAPKNGQIKSNTWIGNIVYASVVTDTGWGLYKIDSKEIAKGWTCEVEDQTRTMTQLRTVGNNIVFESDLDGVNNIYMYNPSAKHLQKMTNARYGAFDIMVDTVDNELYYSDFDNKGYHPVKVSLDSLDWRSASFRRPFKFKYADMFSAQAKQHIQLNTAAEDSLLLSEIEALPSKKYHKSLNAIHIHSWVPFYFDMDEIKALTNPFSFDNLYLPIYPGFVLVSQNMHSTAITTLGYAYRNGFHSGHLKFSYSGFFPIFDLAVNFNDRHRTQTDYHYSTSSNHVYLTQETDKPLLDASLKIYTPLNFGNSGWDSNLIPEISFNFSNDRFRYYGGDYQYNRNLKYGLTYFRVIPKNRMRLFPKLGFGIEAKGAYARGTGELCGNMYFMRGYCYLPGFAQNQGIKLTLSYQRYEKGLFDGSLDNFTSMPRGYKKSLLNNFKMASIDYGIPIYIGEDDLLGFLYLMRINLAPFADFAINTHNGRTDKYFSYGSAVLFNGHYFHIGGEISLGFRYARYWDFTSSSWKGSIKGIVKLGL